MMQLAKLTEDRNQLKKRVNELKKEIDTIQTKEYKKQKNAEMREKLE